MHFTTIFFAKADYYTDLLMYLKRMILYKGLFKTDEFTTDSFATSDFYQKTKGFVTCTLSPNTTMLGSTAFTWAICNTADNDAAAEEPALVRIARPRNAWFTTRVYNGWFTADDLQRMESAGSNLTHGWNTNDGTQRRWGLTNGIMMDGWDYNERMDDE
jgi:hypothetical protein